MCAWLTPAWLSFCLSVCVAVSLAPFSLGVSLSFSGSLSTAVRDEVGDEVDLMVDVHGPPWLTPRVAIALGKLPALPSPPPLPRAPSLSHTHTNTHTGKQLEPYNLMFFEDPIAPENYKALAKVRILQRLLSNSTSVK